MKLHVAGPEDSPVGVLVLAGSSGRVESDRCRVLADAGARAASYRWFGEAIDRVPWSPSRSPWRGCSNDMTAGGRRYVAGCGGRAGARCPASRHRRRRGDQPSDVVGDDAVWPSLAFAERIVDRRDVAGLETTLVAHHGAGHRVLLPGENPATGGLPMARGGTAAADAELGELAWPAILRALGLSA